MEQQRQVVRRSYPAGVPCWIDTQQPDVEAAMAFYGGLFGWEFRDTTKAGVAGRYVIAELDGQEAGAIAGLGDGIPAWNTYVSVEDAEAAARHLLSAGATLKSAAADAGSGGVQAVLADPQWSRIPHLASLRTAGSPGS